MLESTLQNTIVTASAGTGKTYRLVSELVAALSGTEGRAPVAPEKILALTFTEKAAAEMKTRLVARLGEKAPPDLGAAMVTTYHSFCAKILREYADRVGIDAEFVLLDTFDERELCEKVAGQVLLEHLNEADPTLLSLVARLSFAGVVDSLIKVSAQLVESGGLAALIAPPQVPEPLELVSSDMLGERIKMVARAFAFYDAETLSEGARAKVESGRAAFARLCAILEGSSSEGLELGISSAFTSLKGALAGRFGKDEPRRQLMGAIAALGSVLCTSFLVPETRAFHRLLIDYEASLSRYKKQHLCLAFGDLLSLVQRLLRDDLVARRAIKARFERVLVDEYQDTNPCQEDIVALICETSDDELALSPHESALSVLKLCPGKLFVVGDPKQSIYGFRGSEVALFEKMATSILGQGGAEESLNKSYRSEASVVALVNAAVPCPVSEQLVAQREGQSVAGAVIAHEDEALGIAGEVQALLSARSEVALGRSFEPSDIVVLVRRVKKAAPIMQALLSAGVPARIVGGEGFFERQEIVELISALLLVCKPDDALALLTVMRSPLLRFPDSAWALLFEQLQAQGASLSLSSLMAAAPAFHDDEFETRLASFCESLAFIKEHQTVISALEALERVMHAMDYAAQIANDPEASLCFANIEKLKHLLLKSEGDFATQVTKISHKMQKAAKEALGEEATQANVVRIMTIHQSKGLEFPVVFVADTGAGIPSDASDLLFDAELGLALNHRGRPIAVCAPDGKEWVERFATPIQAIRAKQRHKSESELSRLLYVALTRARELVYFVDPSAKEGLDAQKDRGLTLRTLFKPARDLLPAIEPVFASHVIASNPAIASDPVIASEAPQFSASMRTLRYASDLLSPPAPSPLLRAQRLTYNGPDGEYAEMSLSERGRLMHDAIGLATQQLSTSDFEDADCVRAVVEAAFRMRGYDSLAKEALIDRCIATLETVIWPLKKAGFSFAFEVPLVWEHPDFVVKGFADAIATRDELHCVIDFKSSRTAAQSHQTRLQLLAYCAALRGKKRFYASSVIGSRDALDFESYDETAEQALLAQFLA